MFHRILVPVDGSEPALRAARVALDLARADGPAGVPATVELLSAVSVPQALVLVAGVGEEALEGYVDQIGRDALASARTVFAEAGVAAQIKIVPGPAGEAIIDEVESFAADVVVMGKRGLGELRGLFVGSVSDRVAHRVQVPVILVP